MVTLTPRSFPSDGNAFYVLLSTVIYDTHDSHVEVRRQVWSHFCEKTVGLSLDDVLRLSREASANGSYAAPNLCFNEETCRGEEWFDAWISTFDPRGGGRIDLTHPRYADALITMAKTHSMNRVEAPAMEIVCPLVTEIFGIVIVLYVGSKEKYLKQEPSRIWYPPGYSNTARLGTPTGTVSTLVKHVHLLQTTPGGGDIQLLVRPNPLTRPIPTRVVGTLNLRERQQEDVDKPWESDLVKQHAVYTLGVYDSVRRKHYMVGRFIAPETGRNPKAKLTHYMNLDARFALSDTLVFIVGGCQATSQPIYIFATKTVSGQRHAVLIGYWPVDYTDPRIGLEKTDDGIVIVPVNDKTIAAQVLMSECSCVVAEHR